MILQAILSYLPAKKADSLKKRLLHAKHSTSSLDLSVSIL